MLFKVGDVLEYRNGYSGIILSIDDDWITLEYSDGEKFTLHKSQLVSAIASGMIKFRSFSSNVKPPLFVKKHKI